MSGKTSQAKGIDYLKDKKIGINPEKKGDIRILISKWLKTTERGIEHSQINPKNLERIKKFFHARFIPTLETFPKEEYFRIHQQTAEDMGFGRNHRITDQEIRIAIEDQKNSLDRWIEYLSSQDSSSFPTWSKYWAFMGIVRMSGKTNVSNETGEISYPKREKYTISGFPELNREALGLAVNHIVSLVEQGKKLEESLKKESFQEVYTYFLNKLRKENSIKELEITEGEWVKYNQGSNTETLNNLVSSLEGKNTGWCTAGKSTAKAQLLGGDFYVYYSNSSTLKPNPRIAIRTEGSKIIEIRGIARFQELDETIADTSILDDKLAEFGSEAEIYLKKSSNMKMMKNIIENLKKDIGYKLSTEEEGLLSDEVIGFGYSEDPRADQIRSLIYFRQKYDFSNLDENTIQKIIKDEIKIENSRIKKYNEDPEYYDYVRNFEPSIFKILRFLDKDLHPKIAIKLIEEGQENQVAHNLYNFSILNAEIANKLLNKGYFSAVSLNIDKFPDIDNLNLLNKLIEIGNPQAVASNVTIIRNVGPDVVAEILLKNGFELDLLNNINNFPGLMLDKEIADKLIESGNIRVVVENLDRFTDLDTDEVIKKLVEKKLHYIIIENYEKISPATAQEVVDKYIEEGNGEELLDMEFENTQSRELVLNKSTAYKLVETGQGKIVAQNIKKFSGINESDIANKLINSGQERSLLFNLDKFSELDPTIADKLMDKEHKVGLLNLRENIDKFKDIDLNKFVDKIMTLGEYGDEIAYNLVKFKGLNQREFFNKLLKSKKTNGIRYFIENFYDLNPKEITEVANILINSGEIRLIADFLNKFPEIDQNEVAEKIIETGNIMPIVKNIGKFRKLNKENIIKLINAKIERTIAYSLSSFESLSEADRLEIARLIANTGDPMAINKVADYLK